MRLAKLACAIALSGLAPSHATPGRSTQQEKASKPQAAPPAQVPAAEMSARETVASALLRQLDEQEYEVRSAAEFMPGEKYNYRPSQSDFGGTSPGYGPAEMRTFAAQIKHVACSNFAFAA